MNLNFSAVNSQYSFFNFFSLFFFFLCSRIWDRQIFVLSTSIKWVYFSFILRLRVCSSLMSQHSVDIASYWLSHLGHVFISRPLYPMQLSWWKLKVSVLSSTSQRKIWLWPLLNSWVSSFTLILASVDSAHLCQFSNAIKDVFFYLIQHFSHFHWQGLSKYLVYRSARNRSWL